MSSRRSTMITCIATRTSFSHLIEQAGYRYGRVEETFHYHQQMRKRTAWGREVRVQFDVEPTREEEIRTCLMQAKGIVKYMNPTLKLVEEVHANTRRLEELGTLSQAEFGRWARNESRLARLSAHRLGLRDPSAC